MGDDVWVCLGALPPQAQHWVGPGRKARRELWPAVTGLREWICSVSRLLSREVVINQ